MNKQIHVVEDDKDIRDIIGIILEEEGFGVKLFQDVNSFHQGMNGTKPDLYLLDVMLPDGNGLDLCKEIKTTELMRDVPVIVMSAHAKAENIFKLSCANDFISKPFDLDDIIRKIHRQVDE